MVAPEGYDVKTKVATLARNMSRQLSVRQVSLYDDGGANELCGSARVTDEGNALYNATRIVRDTSGWSLICLTDTAGVASAGWRHGWRRLLRRLYALAAGAADGSAFRLIIAIDDDAAAQLPPQIMRDSYAMAATTFPLLPLRPAHIALPTERLDAERHTMLGYRCVVDTLLIGASEAARVASLWSAFAAAKGGASPKRGGGASPKRAVKQRRKATGPTDDDLLIASGILQKEHWEAFPSEEDLPREYVLATAILHSALKLVLSLGAQCCPHLASYGESGVGFSDAQLCAVVRRMCLLALRTAAMPSREAARPLRATRDAPTSSAAVASTSVFLGDAKWCLDALVRQIYVSAWSDGALGEAEFAADGFGASLVVAYGNALTEARAILARLRETGATRLLPPPIGPPPLATETLLGVVGRRTTAATDCAAVALRALRDVRSVASARDGTAAEKAGRIAAQTVASAADGAASAHRALSLVLDRAVSPAPAVLRLAAPVRHAAAIFAALRIDFAKHARAALEDVCFVASFERCRSVGGAAEGAPPALALDGLDLSGCVWDAARDALVYGSALTTFTGTLDETVYVHATVRGASSPRSGASAAKSAKEFAKEEESEEEIARFYQCPVYERGKAYGPALFDIALRSLVEPRALSERAVFLTM
jgi:hypothetical protein